MAAQGTANYVYFTDQQLGLGASGSVFLGRHKVTRIPIYACTLSVLYFISYRPGGPHAASVTLEIDFGFPLIMEQAFR